MNQMRSETYGGGIPIKNAQRGEVWTKRCSFVLLLISLFFLLGYDGIHHWDEPYYLFTAAFENPSDWGVFYMFKYGHLLILKALIAITGIGLKGLVIINFVYALMMLCFVLCSFLILKEIARDEAFYGATVALFLPVTLYLSYKELAEVPSVLFGALSLLFFIYGLQSNRARKFLFFIVSSFLLCLSVLCKFEAPIMFLSFFIALAVTCSKEYGLKKLFCSFLLTSLLSLAFMLIALTLSNIDLSGMITYFFQFQEETRYTWLENSLMFFLVGGFFYPFAFFSLFNRGKEWKFAIVWLTFSLLFTIFLMDHVEPRRLCWSLIPLAILILMGLKEVFKRVKQITPSKSRILFATLLCIILISNNLLLAAAPDKIDERAYSKMLQKIDAFSENRTLLVSTSYDFDFLRFAFPEEHVLYVRDELEREEVMRLLHENSTMLYLTWNISRDFFIYEYERSNYNESWVTSDQKIALKKVLEEKRYSAYLVSLV
jgi:hypothetical protein